MPVPELNEEVRACCQALDDKKAEDIIVLYLGPESSLADYFVIATGTSDPHLRALVNNVEATLREHNVDCTASEKASKTGWMVVDAYDIIVHVFTAETRRYFNLEGLWRDARRIEVSLPAPVSAVR